MTCSTPGHDIRGVVFDMDGVLIDSHPAHHTAWREFLLMSGFEVSDTQLSFILEGRTRNEILRHFFPGLNEEEVLAYGKRKDEIFRAIEHEIKPIPGVLEFIDQLKRQGISIAIATSASEIRTSSTIERMGLGGRFEAVITANDVFEGKPDPAVYSLACQSMGFLPADTLAFDDACAGIKAARSAGMRCVGVANNGRTANLMAAGAERVIPDFVGFDFPARAPWQHLDL